MSTVTPKKNVVTHHTPHASSARAASAPAGNVLPGSAGRLSGIDFSSNDFSSGASIGAAAQVFQKDIQGQQYAFVKATQGTGYQNPYFGSEWKILGQKVKSGQMALRVAYHFMDPGTYSDGVAQAKAFLKTTGVNGKLPGGTKLALDWEMAATSTPAVLQGAADYVHKVTGQWPIVYTSSGTMGQAHQLVPGAPKWEANYGPSYRGIGDQGGKDLPSGSDTFYQYSDGRGYGLPYDMNVYNGSLASLKKFAGTPGPVVNPELEKDKQGNAAIAKQLASAGPIQQGANEPAVKWLGRMLGLAGYDAGKSSNRFTAKMTTAVSQFQESEGLPTSGALDAGTFEKLKAVQGQVRQQQKLGQKDLFVQGEKSAQVAKDQKMLSSLGYQVGNTQGVYDSKTVAAELAFRKDDGTVHQKNKDLTLGLQGVLAKDTGALNHSAYFERLRPSTHNSQLDAETTAAAAATNADQTVGIGAGSHGDPVRNVQARLLAAGFDPKGINGKWDLRTETALKDFQSKSGLPSTGRVDSGTWSKLDKAYLYATSNTSPAQSVGEKDSAVVATQKLLKKDGFTNLSVPSGEFGARTLADVKAFQHKDHLKVTGQVDAKTLSALEHFSVGPSTDRSKIYLQQPNGWSCAPTSLTMAEAAWGVAKPTDATMFRLAADMGDGPGTGLPGNASLVAAQARRDGLQASYNPSPQASAVRRALQAGHTCVVNGSLGVGGHFIYIGGLDSHGRYIVFDPFRPGVTTWSDADLNAFTHVGTNPPGFAEIWK